jgi:hypothetical protein
MLTLLLAVAVGLAPMPPQMRCGSPLLASNSCSYASLRMPAEPNPNFMVICVVPTYEAATLITSVSLLALFQLHETSFSCLAVRR